MDKSLDTAFADAFFSNLVLLGSIPQHTCDKFSPFHSDLLLLILILILILIVNANDLFL